MTTKSLADGNVSLSSESAKSRGLMPSSSNGGADSESEPGDSEVGAPENRIRVSATDKEGIHRGVDGGGGIRTRTEISVETSIGGRNGGVSGEEAGFRGDAKVTGCPSSSVDARQDRGVHDGGSKTGRSLDSDLVVEKNDENGGEKIAAHGNSALLIGDGSVRKVEFDGNGISLLVDVHGSVNMKVKKCGDEADKGSLAKNGGNPSQKFAEMPGTMSKMEKNGDVTGVERVKKKKNATGKENEDKGEVVDQQNGEEDEDDMGDQEHEFFVGDFVWGKIRSHPWWPGRIYDPSDASEYAAKYTQRDRLLVAYFGDGSFSWCSPSQLQLFGENFEEMSKQSSSKSFVNAVQKALDEIGRLVELEMTCSCIQEENQIGLTRSSAVNGGIKQGVLVPEGGIGRPSIPQYQPEELLAILRCAAQVVSITSMLDFTVLKSWLSAFYRAKGGYQLATYHESLNVEGLEDERGNGVMNMTDLNGPVETLEEDWLSSPVNPESGQTSQSLLQKCPEISPDKLYQRRKQKSVAELMAEDMDVGPKNKEGSIVKELTRTGEQESTAGKKKRKRVDEAESRVGSDLTSPSGRKKVEILVSPKSTENKVSSVESDGVEGKKDTKKGSASREGKRKKVSGIGSDDGRAKEETEMISSPRERKKSKYLSPPYTNMKWRVKDSSAKSDPERESLEVAKAARMGERMTRAAGQLIGSPPIMKCSGETFQKKLSKEPDTGCDSSAISSHEPLSDQQIIETLKINASPNEVLSKVRSAALNPSSLKENKSDDMIMGFLMTFRSSIYLNGSNYKIYRKSRPGRKRKSLDSEPGSQGKGLSQTKHESPKSKSQRTGSEKKEQAKSDIPKLKQAARASGMKTNDKGTSEKASGVALMLTFPPGFSLPSKENLIAIFRKFGALDEMETNVLYNSFCARVVFLKSSDAEQAFSVSVKKSPFGAANVNYRLRYPSSASKVGRKASSPPEDGSKTSENPSASKVGRKASSLAKDGSRSLENPSASKVGRKASSPPEDGSKAPENPPASKVGRKASSPPKDGSKTPENPSASKVGRKASSPPKDGSKTPENPSASQSLVNEASRFLFIKQKLEMMTSMLEKSDGKMSPDLKSNLEGEMKELLGKSKRMGDNSSELELGSKPSRALGKNVYCFRAEFRDFTKFFFKHGKASTR
ncbi:hypothetical protein F0562_004938 [Nyssa sinensis]|uniref:PWWP domain-containing protein n=1 Tax=Nyssa sinensis TaxID=561372 RepID=A0A5J5AJ64_9ASTE|nr:hypothetical protein F0562_004938 [Nyssa sinensis]